VAFKTGRCAGKTIEYEATCTFDCLCLKSIYGGRTFTHCSWHVTCGGKRVSGGPAGPKPRVRPTEGRTVYVDGLLRDLAASLEEVWGWSVTVPRANRGKRVTGTFRGTPEKICDQLGLKLGD
jgi:hypothetical protein